MINPKGPVAVAIIDASSLMIDPAVAYHHYPTFMRAKNEGVLLQEPDGSIFKAVVWPGVTAFPDCISGFPHLSTRILIQELQGSIQTRPLSGMANSCASLILKHPSILMALGSI